MYKYCDYVDNMWASIRNVCVLKSGILIQTTLRGLFLLITQLVSTFLPRIIRRVFLKLSIISLSVNQLFYTLSTSPIITDKRILRRF